MECCLLVIDILHRMSFPAEAGVAVSISPTHSDCHFTGGKNKEAENGGNKEKQLYSCSKSSPEDKKDSAEEERPLCSGIMGYPSVRDHTLGLDLDDNKTVPVRDSLAQCASYKGKVSVLTTYT